MVGVRLEWALNHDSDNVARYEIERRTIEIDAAVLGKFNRFLHNSMGAKSLMGGWRQVGEVPSTQNYFEDNGRMLVRRFFRPTYYHNTEILDYVHYEYRIRAVSHTKKYGPWVHCRISPLTAPPLAPGYIITGHVGSAITPDIYHARIVINNIHTPRFGQELTERDGNYTFNLGTTPPTGASTDTYICEAPGYFTAIRMGVPIPNPTTPNIICNFNLTPIPIIPRGIPHWRGMPPGYHYWP